MKAWYIVIIGLAMLFTGCEEMENMFDEFGVSMNTEYYQVEVIIPPAPSGIEITIYSLMETNLDQMLESKGYRDATVNSIRVLDADIEVAEDSKIRNLNPVETIVTRMLTEFLPEVTVATYKNTVTDAVSAPMETEDTDVSAYMEDEEYILSTSGMLRETTTDTLRLRGRIRYRLGLTVRTVNE
jgi:hypothetical protein